MDNALLKRVLDEMFQAYQLGLPNEEFAKKVEPLFDSLTVDELQEVTTHMAAESSRLQGIAASRGRITESILDRAKTPN